ncbi:hypothetical protein SAY87_021146 [Trapa incisa]|uniref:galactinol--sucrose galactosyltransferase n=1 Tax=Trapa incisa TaxID=236973 RepID=A0AAN7JWQ6_9MYRT|nr:hypothetical protein SAY87_021146 [Trapa incisa]
MMISHGTTRVTATTMFLAPPSCQRTLHHLQVGRQSFFSPGIQSIRFSDKKWRQSQRHSMFLGARPTLKDGALSVNGTDVMTCVPENVVVTPLTNSSAFMGASSTVMDSRHVFKLGLIQGVRLLSLYRFKLWWMMPRVGDSGSDIPVETQMLLLEVKEHESSDEPNYLLFLPVLDEDFRSSLQGNSADELELCIESGDPAIVTTESRKAVFINYGENPFELMKESIKLMEKQMGTFSHRETKQMPGILEYFGWCTWDAFYHDVNPKGIMDGLKSLSDGGTPAKFLIIDDGWQDTTNEFQKEGEPFVDGSQFGGRLLSIKENHKFRRQENGAPSSIPNNLKEFTSYIKENFGLKYVYVWHALLGYWGGLVPGASGTEKYRPEMRYPVQSPGNLANTRDLAMDCMDKYGIGTLDPALASQFYEDLHSYLVSQNVDGVKVDVQNILETIATGLGGRVSLTRVFQKALEKSIAANFQDNSIICCMGLSTDSIYHCKQSAITRASDDYYPQNPRTQTLHIASVSYNSIFLGEIFVPDWDMFYSLHDAAEYHASARAVGGCAVYVSDKPGHHDFEILKRLVLPDGSILRAKYPGRPSRDCLFNDPVMDRSSLLKIWNLNNCTGVLGVFNCQGAGSWPGMEIADQEDQGSFQISGKVSLKDIEYFEEVAGDSWNGDAAVFSFKSGSLCRLSKYSSMEVVLGVLQCDVLTFSPIKVYDQKVEFAPIGLINMYNAGGAVETVESCNEVGSSSNPQLRIKGRGSGTLGAFSDARPKSCFINSEEGSFEFSQEDNLLTVRIPARTISWDIVLSY